MKRQGKIAFGEALHTGRFVAWLKLFDPRDSYDYSDTDRCPIAEYLHATTGTRYRVSPGMAYNLVTGKSEALPLGWNSAILAWPWTYGEAVKRMSRYKVREAFHDDGEIVSEKTD